VGYRVEVLADNLVGYWRLGESSGTVTLGVASNAENRLYKRFSDRTVPTRKAPPNLQGGDRWFEPSIAHLETGLPKWSNGSVKSS
jgi:hypothetical protein